MRGHGPEGQAQDRQALERELKGVLVNRGRKRGQTAINEGLHSKAPSSAPLFQFLPGPLEPLNSFTSCGVTLINASCYSFKKISFLWKNCNGLVSTANVLPASYTWRRTWPQQHPRLSPPWVILTVANSIILGFHARRKMWWK